MVGSSTAPNHLFVGGTGRCGTHAIGRLLNTHTRYQRVHTELRFHADPYALPGLLRGSVTLDEYMNNLRGRWWKRISARGMEQGLFNRISEEIFTPAAAEFERNFPDDPWGASTKLIHDLIDPQSKRKPGWIELTKRNVEASPILTRLIPDSKVINMVRDGRDVSSSVVAQAWGPTDFDETLPWWEKRMSVAEAASSQIPEDRLLVVDFQDFVSEAREETFQRLLDFTGTTGKLARARQIRMRRYFAKQIGGGSANLERWREGMSEEKQAETTERYAAALERLIAADGPGRPVFERWLAKLARNEVGNPV